MTPDKDETMGYTVAKVNTSDFTKPAAAAGVKPGWVMVAINGVDVMDV